MTPPFDTEWAHDDFMIVRSDRYVAYLRERYEHYLHMLLKRTPGGLVPIGAEPLTERQEFIMLRTLYEQARLIESGQAQPTPPVAAFMADPEAQQRMVELAMQFADEARSG